VVMFQAWLEQQKAPQAHLAAGAVHAATPAEYFEVCQR